MGRVPFLLKAPREPPSPQDEGKQPSQFHAKPHLSWSGFLLRVPDSRPQMPPTCPSGELGGGQGLPTSWQEELSTLRTQESHNSFQNFPFGFHI